MTTQTIGIKEFRQNISKLHAKARKQNIRYIVMSHQTPLWRIEPIDEDQLILEKFGKDIDEALAQFDRGETYSSEEIRKRLLGKKA